MLPPSGAAPRVPDHLRSWSVPWPDYNPVDVTPAELRTDGTLAASIRDGWAEPATDPTVINYTPRQATALVPFDVVNRRPRNPAGRTGRSGRALGRWGENTAADPIVIADTDTGRHVLLIRRDDCGDWAIPGGMVEPGEHATATLLRELGEETGVGVGVDPVVLARTYVDDPRATDHAWICSTVALFGIPAPVDVHAGSDALAAQWWPFDGVDGLRRAIHAAGGLLYEPHAPLLAAAHLHLTRDGGERETVVIA